MSYIPHENGHASDIECGKCGSSFYYELYKCPQCGAPVFGDEEEEDESSIYAASQQAGKGRASAYLPEAGPLILGLFVSGLLLAVLYFPLQSAFSAAPDLAASRLLLILTGAFSALVGGWFAGRFSARSLRTQGLLVGAGSLILAVLFYQLVYNQAAALFSNPDFWPGLPLILLSGWGGAAAAERMQRQNAVESLFGPVIQENILYQRLLSITGYDKDTVERLIAFEGRRYPQATRLERMQRAVERWERDNR
jgi:hypothetical protein